MVFNNVLYAVYESTDKDSHKPTGRISYISCTDGKKWESPEKTDTKDGYGTTGAPALIVLGDTLYAFHEGFQQNRQLWFATAKSVNGDLQWQGDNDSKFGTTGAPALAIYKGEDGKDQIYCVHLGDDGQSLWWARYNGTKWTQSDTRLGNQAAATRPSLCVWDDKLYCVYQGAGNGEFWYVYYNGKEWTPGNKTAYATYGAPGLAAYNNKLYAFHEGYLGAAGGVTAGANIGGTIGAGVGTVAGSVGGPGGLATGGVAGTLAGEGVGATIGAIAGAANPRSYKLWYTGCEKAKADFTEPNDTDTGFGVTDPPALVVANNTLYCVHGGHDGNGEIWWFYIGTNGELSGDEQLNGLTGSPPALIEFDGQLYSVYQRGGGDDKIAWTTLPFNSHADHPDNPDKKWTEIRGANSYGYDMIDRQAAGDGAVSTSKTINVQAGTPVVYAALTNTEDDIDFPNGATLTITAPDGSTFSSARDDDTAVVVLSGQTLQALVLLAPKASDYKVELSVPAKTPFHFEFEAAPTKDVATTILNAFATAGQSLARRDVNDPAALNQQLSVLAAGAIAQLARLLIIYAKKKGNQPAVSWSHTILAATSVIVGIYVSSTILGRSRTVPTAQNQRLTRILLENLEENDYTQAAALTGTFRILRPSSREVETYTDFQRFRRATRRGQRRPGMQNIDTNNVHPEDIAVQVQFDGWASPSPWFRINGEDAYINAVNPDPPGTMTNTVTFNETGWREINNVTYRTAGVINRNSIRAAFQDAANLGNNPTRPTPGAPRRGNPQTGTVEIVAFVLAEAIRFEVVGNAIDRLYASDAAGDETGFQWETFRPLLNNWQRIYDQVYDGQRTFAIPMQVTRDFVNRTGDFAGFNIGNWDPPMVPAMPR